MKIIHTGDWHIGKVVNEFSMIEDQEFVLDQLIKIIEEERPHALVIAGDLYDRSIPPVEAVELLDKTFSKILLDLNTPILVIAGNHDSAERLSFGSRILNQKGLHIAGNFTGEISKVSLSDSDGDVNFYLVPYANPKEIKHVLGDEEIVNYDDAMDKIVSYIRQSLNNQERNVMITHGYITFMGEEAIGTVEEDIHTRLGLDISDSERPLSIGGTDIINGKHFDCFNYTALGHLHGPQRVGSDRIRYSGSLLKYSFSEVNHKKGVTIVNINKDGKVDVDLRELMPRRDMRVITGPLNELINPQIYRGTNIEDYIYAILTDEGELVDPISKLRAVYPNIMGLSRENAAEKGISRTSAASGYKEKSKLDLFDEFYKSISARELTEEKIEILKEVIEDVERGDIA